MRTPLRLLVPRFTEDEIIRRVGLAVRPGRAKGEVVTLAHIKIRLIPGVDANYARQIARTEVIDGGRLFFSNYIEPTIVSKFLQRRGYHV